MYDDCCMKKAHTSTKTGLLVEEFDSEKKEGVYYVNPECSFYKFSETISFKGFKKRPKGFSSDGFGFAKPASSYFLSMLRDTFGDKCLSLIHI